MQIDPPLAALFSALPSAVPSDIAERRAAANATFMLLHRDEPGTVVSEHELTVDGGTITLRVRRPADAGVLPAAYFIHGGGWALGDLDTAEVESGSIATEAQCVVVTVDYRLAPEHPFPVPFEDVMAGWVWLHETAAQHGIDPARVAVAGTSAGGNLAAALCVAARDRGLPMPLVQLLDVPAVDLTCSSPSLAEIGDGVGLGATEVRELASWYAGSTPLDHPYLSPLHAASLAGLPPAVVLTAEHDPIRDDGERWVAALQEAGVPACGLRVLTHVHGSWLIPITLTAGLVTDLRVNVLRRAFAGTLTP